MWFVAYTRGANKVKAQLTAPKAQLINVRHVYVRRCCLGALFNLLVRSECVVYDVNAENIKD